MRGSGLDFPMLLQFKGARLAQKGGTSCILRKETYITSLAHKPGSSLMVSLADKTHNAGAIVADLAVHGDALWHRFTGGRDGSLWYYRALVTAFRARIGGAGTERFAALVAQMNG